MNTSEKIQSGFSVMLTLFAIPIMILNVTGGIIAGIWLIIIGKWLFVIWALLTIYIATKILGLVTAPTLLLMNPLTKALEKHKYTKAYILGALSHFWTYLVMTVWCVGSFIYIIYSFPNTNSIWPFLLLGYCVATGPWVYMASMERSTEIDVSSIGSFFVCLGTVAMMAVILFYKNPTFAVIITTFSIVMLVAWIISIAFFVLTVRANRI